MHPIHQHYAHCSGLIVSCYGLKLVDLFMYLSVYFLDMGTIIRLPWWRHQMEKFSMQRIHRSPVKSPPKGQWRGALLFSLICTWINGWVSNREAGDFRHHRAHYDVIVMPGTNKVNLKIMTRKTTNDQSFINNDTWIPAWISSYIHYKKWDEITYPFQTLTAQPMKFRMDN